MLHGAQKEMELLNKCDNRPDSSSIYKATHFSLPLFDTGTTREHTNALNGHFAFSFEL